MFDIAFGGYLTHAVLRAREELAGRSHVDLAGAESDELAGDLRKQFGLGYVRKDPEKGIKIKRPGFGGAHFELRYYVRGGQEALLPFAQSMSLPRTRKLIAASAGAGAVPAHTAQLPHTPMPPQMPVRAEGMHPGAVHGHGQVPGHGGMGTSFAGSMYGPGVGMTPGAVMAGAVHGGGGFGAGFGTPGGGVGVQSPPEQQRVGAKPETAQSVSAVNEPLVMEMMRSRFMPRADIGALVALTDGNPEDAMALSGFIEEYLRSLNKDIEQANAQLGEALRQMCDGVCRQARAAVEMTKDKEAGLQAAGFDIE